LPPQAILVAKLLIRNTGAANENMKKVLTISSLMATKQQVKLEALILPFLKDVYKNNSKPAPKVEYTFQQVCVHSQAIN
jgi:hypothetical protein